MTIRVVVNPLDQAGKLALVRARLTRDRQAGASAASAKLTLAELAELRQARPNVVVPDQIVQCVLEIYQALMDEKSGGDFQWAWADDRRFGRIFDILQAHALLDGRSAVTKADLAVLEWLLWDTPEQIAVVKGVIAPYCRTPLDDARELVDALLAPGGTVADVRAGSRAKGVQALTQVEESCKALETLKGTAGSMADDIETLLRQVAGVKQEIIAVITGAVTAPRR